MAGHDAPEERHPAAANLGVHVETHLHAAARAGRLPGDLHGGELPRLQGLTSKRMVQPWRCRRRLPWRHGCSAVISGVSQSRAHCAAAAWPLLRPPKRHLRQLDDLRVMPGCFASSCIVAGPSVPLSTTQRPVTMHDAKQHVRRPETTAFIDTALALGRTVTVCRT